MPVQTELNDIIENLAVHEANLTLELGDLSAQAKRVGNRLDQIQSALAALRDGKPNAKPTRGGDAAQRKRRASTSLVQELATAVLTKNECLSFDQLLDGVKSAMLARGLSRVGAKALLSEAIATPAFTINPDETVSVK